MNGDLSLSQSLGGLRIANPDDDDTNVPSTTHEPASRPPHSSHSSASTVTGRPTLPTLSHDTQEQQAGQYTSHPAGYRQPGEAARPPSAMYSQPNNSSVSSAISNTASYRYRDNVGPPDARQAALARSGSRSARQVMGSVPQRENSRSYGPTGGNPVPGGLPQRRSSQKMRPSGSSAGGYDGGDGPYAGGAQLPSSAEEWRDRGAATGTVRETDASGQVRTQQIKKGVKDFKFGRTLGEGSYSTVLAATDRTNLKEYAIKVLDKRHIIKEKKVKYVNIERDTLNRLTEHPGIVRLYYTFQDERSLYFVLDVAAGGELLTSLKKLGSFNVECTRFYGAEILDSIAYMHSRGVIHRDLKPENVLLDDKGHVKITDFGTAKILADPRRDGITSGDATDASGSDRAGSFVGTAEYVSPELLREKSACKASDLWAFGCMIYQLLAGRPPFKAANEYLTFQKIMSLEYHFPDGFPDLARDLVERLLVLEPARRLPVEHIRNHEFFDGITWGKNLWRQEVPTLRPYVPPVAPPIKLNGASRRNGSSNQTPTKAPSNAPPQQTRRPQLLNVTELAPPSQLDIDWSPVLTRNNERILKLGNLIVTTAPAQANSPTGKGGDPSPAADKPKFSRFFSSNTTKKRERLVLITSAARLVVAAMGGNEKKAKLEINLAGGVTSGAKSFVDGKGLTYWTFDTRDKHYTFEDPRATTSDPQGSKYSTQEWLDAVDLAREVAIATSLTNSYSSDSMLNDGGAGTSGMMDGAGGDRDAAMPLGGPSVGDRHNLRHTLRKNTDDGTGAGGESLKGRRRFSKRHSKSGLAAVF
ncbi:uncharacterized protein MYCGRDRAFT_65163 [Zymoseptoria tritici IPO323]|uniref:non-specific serine/threonine protein kinase n=1 Tax=Zymoseptoria tritici (strain CBS 115943 / IPO323) TaxID=336722 RepID=F9WW42_ZYMTI|nr:uncharacterized protein MYCGRDRAFT_65163 [Zymoseptoria tritici IPO323]EGP90945.1 hypothetical protein MYCGRDRAFT_65163 [Zymoseptoria tritici IPO323]